MVLDAHTQRETLCLPTPLPPFLHARSPFCCPCLYLCTVPPLCISFSPSSSPCLGPPSFTAVRDIALPCCSLNPPQGHQNYILAGALTSTFLSCIKKNKIKIPIQWTSNWLTAALQRRYCMLCQCCENAFSTALLSMLGKTQGQSQQKHGSKSWVDFAGLALISEELLDCTMHWDFC